MGIMVYSLLWVMQDFVHQPQRPYNPVNPKNPIIPVRPKSSRLSNSSSGTSPWPPRDTVTKSSAPESGRRIRGEGLGHGAQGLRFIGFWLGLYN